MTNFPKDPTYNEAAILKILAEAKRPVQMREIQRILTQIKYKIGRASVFSILKSLIGNELVEHKEGTESVERGRPAGSYEITEKGMIEILEVQAKIRKMLSLTIEK